ncbi:MAG: hypothetical protein ACT4QE_00765 [Anaerolineales bacterium]
MTTPVAAPPQTNIVKFLTSALIAGVIAAVINNTYSLVYTAITGNSITLVGPIGITIASILPILIGGLGYSIVARFVPARATLIFTVGTLVLAALSLSAVFGSQLPDGSTAPAWFAALTAPMHIIAGVVCAFGLPRFVNQSVVSWRLLPLLSSEG